MASMPKVNRNWQKNEAIKRKGMWSKSKKDIAMTCEKYGELNHNVRTCGQVNYNSHFYVELYVFVFVF